jgi:hypothetical protein
MNTTALSAVTLCSLMALYQSALTTNGTKQQVTAATLYGVTSTQNNCQFAQ